MIDPTVTVSIATPTLALVSNATVFVDGEAHPGVITVQRFEDDQIEITVQPLTKLPYPMHLEIVLDSTDLSHIKSLLDAQDRAAQVQPSNPPDPSNGNTGTDEILLTSAADDDALTGVRLTAENIRQLRALIDFVEEKMKRVDALEKLNLATCVAYLENRAQGMTGPDAGL